MDNTHTDKALGCCCTYSGKITLSMSLVLLGFVFNFSNFNLLWVIHSSFFSTVINHELSLSQVHPARYNSKQYQTVPNSTKQYQAVLNCSKQYQTVLNSFKLFQTVPSLKAPKGELVPRDVTVVSWLIPRFPENGSKDFSDFWHEVWGP